jgi:hypothetical protein
MKANPAWRVAEVLHKESRRHHFRNLRHRCREESICGSGGSGGGGSGGGEDRAGVT